MNSNNHKNYSSADIRRYVNGQMSAEEMNALERAALDDPFLSDAIDGYMETGSGRVEEDLEDLQVRMKNRIKKEDKQSATVLPSWWKIAALLILVAGGGGLYYMLNTAPEQENITIARNEQMQQSLPLADSLSNDIISLNEPAAQPDARQQVISNAAAESTSKQVPEEPKQVEVATTESKAKMPSPVQPGVPSPAMMKRNENADLPSPEVSKKEAAEARDVLTSGAPREMMNINNFRGKVVNDSNKPVAGASVMVLNSQLGLSTDSNGYFNFSFVDSTARIAISNPGYLATRATIKNSVAINEIKLYQSTDVKEAIATRSRSGNVSRSLPSESPVQAEGQSVEPVNGWTEFEKYLEKNKVIPGNLRNVHGETIISFIVDRGGRPRRFVVEKSLNASLDQEAIRLVQEGPAWKVRDAAEAKGRVTIRF